MNPRITVIIPVYNGMPELKKCLESVVNQTMEEIQVIVIDDGSTDNSGEYAEQIAFQHTNIQVVHQSNHGLYYTREKGLSLASGDYVGWVDSDDYIEPTMFEKLYNAAVNSDSELTYCDYDWFPEKSSTKEKWFRLYQGVRDVDFVERNNQPWNKLAKRELLERLDIGPMFQSCFDESYIKALIFAKNPIPVKEKLYHYRVTGEGMSSSYKNVDHYKKFIDASKCLKMKMLGISDYWDKYFDYRIIYYYLMAMLVASNANDAAEYNRLRKELLNWPYPYKSNQHIDHILRTNFGDIKAFVIKNLISKDYRLTRIIARYVFRKEN